MQSLLRKALIIIISAYLFINVNIEARSILKNKQKKTNSIKNTSTSNYKNNSLTVLENISISPVITKQEQYKELPLISMINANDHEFLRTAKLPILLNIKADWCTTYNTMATSFKAIANELQKKIVCAEISVDSFEDSDETIKFLQSNYNVSINCIPTILVIKDNKIVESIEGTHDKETFKTKILAHLK